MPRAKPFRPHLALHLVRLESRLIPLLSCVSAGITFLAALLLGPSRTLYFPLIFATVWFLSYVATMRLLRDHHDPQ